MKLKFKHIALAAALVATGAAQAAIDTGSTSGDGSLLLNLKWKDTLTTDANGNTSASAAFDLGITMNDAVAWNGISGFKSTWNLSSGLMQTWSGNTMMSSTTIGSYGTAFNTFLNTTDMVLGNAEMNVFALDNAKADGTLASEPGDSRLLSTTSGINATGTGLSLASIPTNNNYNQIFGNTTVVNFLSALNNSAGHNTASNGASNADASSGFAWFDNGSGMDKFANLSGFDSTNKFAGTYAAGTGVLSGQAKALPFYMLVASSNDPFAKASMTPFGVDLDGDGLIKFSNANGQNEFGLWTLQGDTLSYINPVPEAETYAMMLAGLGLMGTIIRRRRKSA
jgi:hypothetical protein